MMKSRDARPASQKAPWRGGLLALAPAAARERKSPREEGLGPSWQGGLLALGFSSSLVLNIIVLTHDSSWEASLQCESLCVASDHQPE